MSVAIKQEFAIIAGEKVYNKREGTAVFSPPMFSATRKIKKPKIKENTLIMSRAIKS